MRRMGAISGSSLPKETCMRIRLRAFAGWAVSLVPTLFTLGLLAGLAVWGARHDWKVPRLSELWEDSDDHEPETAQAGIKIYPDPDYPSPAKDASPLASSMWLEFPSEEAVHDAGLQFAPVQLRRLARTVLAYGMLDYDPGYYAELATRASGTVWRVHKEIGDWVRKGEVLALVEAAEVGKAKADFLQSFTQVDVRHQAVQRMQSAGGSVPEATLHEAEAALREARIRLFNDHQRLLNLGFVLRLEEVAGLSESQLVRHLRLLGVPEDVRKGVDPETLTANLLPLTAPFDAQVVNRKAAPGEGVTPSQPQFVVADTRHIHIDLDVAPEDMPLLQLGQPVTFVPQGDGAQPLKGNLSHFSPEVNEKTRKVQVHAEAPNLEQRYRPHIFGTGRILIEEKPASLVVPNAAVVSDGRNYLVFVRLSATNFQSRPVQLGLRDEAFSEVIGLRTGEEVVTIGSHALKSELLRERIASGED
jgi:cobalt-zinc-cadmium efflux system membrane fusion protein